MSKTLADLRVLIDATDRELLALLNRRAGLANEVGEIKRIEGSPVFRPERLRSGFLAPASNAFLAQVLMKSFTQPVLAARSMAWSRLKTAPKVLSPVHWICS